MTKEERQIVKEKVTEAKEKSQQSTNWVFKIRGPPWNLREVKFRKSEM